MGRKWRVSRWEDAVITEDMGFKHRGIAIFRAMKFQFHDRPSELIIPVYHDRQPVAYLRPVPARLEGVAAKDVELITEWRNRYRENFLTWFTATEERTRKWLMEHVIAKEDRILFMVQTLKGMPFGHMGLDNFDFANRWCEYDNIIRGRDVGPPGAMTLAGRALMHWVFSQLKAETVIVRVFSDNYSAVKLYERCCFRLINKVPLRRIEEPDCVRWVEAEEEMPTAAERYLAYMQVDNPLKQKAMDDKEIAATMLS